MPLHLKATLADYKGSGFDRGPMAPAANHRSTFEIMEDIFFNQYVPPESFIQ
ncbi:hypothetical protein [Candidatus Protochlamydia amoebophila]|uniref:hypothetical protein n=1 Tax=Candidatus Protochlamydia amoebophila TaxID=362787 RepID=UPI003B967DA3